MIFFNNTGVIYMFKAKLAAFTSALILAGTTFASSEVCPDLSAIQAEGFSMSMQVYGVYAAYQISDFGTDENWGFVMAPVEADSEEEAVENANDILNSMTAPGVLIDTGVCNYDTGVPDVYAVAIQDEFPTPLKLRQHIPH
ncbi:DUF4949 domain-containing protein [Legionella lytica]|uniref:DUF4949 domain-containing protein n=2 Tax=Legionella lytica TaxID=96232 RepID=A0ABY4Y593_9GAMM|nr:DUF4949 domain-containing protein [Legionella lytica]